MPLTNGNSKLGKDIWNLNLPRDTCTHKTLSCAKYCYASKGKFNFDAVKIFMGRNLSETLDERFIRRIVGQIYYLDIRYVRIHASGDFYKQQYADKWIEIAKQTPETKFVVFTRNPEIDFSKRPKNLVVYFSVDKTTPARNPSLSLTATAFDATREYKHMEKSEHGYVCQSKCKECKACWSGKINIAFPIR
jgi:hypothetical protein